MSLPKHEELYRASTDEFLQNMKRLLQIDKTCHELEITYCDNRIGLINKILSERAAEPYPEKGIAKEPAITVGPMR